MSSQVVRLTSGDVIQVRTGVLQGIGPQGPVGPAGPQGNTGDTGPQGPPGATGNVIEHYLLATGSGSQGVGTGTAALAAFGTVITDQIGAADSTTNFSPGVGVWYIHAYIQFQKRSGITSVGSRTVRILVNSAVVAEQAQAAAPSVNSSVNCSTGVALTSASDNVQIQVLHDEGASISLLTARLFISRVGPGPAGAAGIQGPEGPVGPVGPEGPQGPAGTVGNNTTTFAQLEAGSG